MRVMGGKTRRLSTYLLYALPSVLGLRLCLGPLLALRLSSTCFIDQLLGDLVTGDDALLGQM
jgi:hypothetical protein